MTILRKGLKKLTSNKTNAKNAVINIKSEQIAFGQAEPMELDVLGKIYTKNNKIYIVYDENDVLTEQNGFTIIKIMSDDEIFVTRNSSYSYCMNFKKGEQTFCNYNMPEGSLLLGINTTKVMWKRYDFGLELMIEYNMEINHSKISDNKFCLKLKENEND